MPLSFQRKTHLHFKIIENWLKRKRITEIQVQYVNHHCWQTKPHLLTTINKCVAWEQVAGVQEHKKKEKKKKERIQSTGFW